jgi:hypothetical protein
MTAAEWENSAPGYFLTKELTGALFENYEQIWRSMNDCAITARKCSPSE